MKIIDYLRVRDPSTTVKMAEAVYLEGITQAEVGKRFGVAQPVVALRLAKMWRDLGEFGITKYRAIEMLREESMAVEE